MHPYIGLKATRPAKPPHRPEITGQIVAVGQYGSSVNEDEAVMVVAVLLLDDGRHTEIELCDLVVDPVEAARRLAAVR